MLRTRNIGATTVVIGLSLLIGCRGPATNNSATSVAQSRSEAVVQQPAAPARSAAPEVVTVGFVEPESVERPTEIPAEVFEPEIPKAKYPIDLPTALQLAEGGSYQVAFARAQVRQAWARSDAAGVLWLPNIRVGLNYNKHEGQIQDIVGNVFPASRDNFWSGLGAGTPGAGSPVFPGISANFHTADALFEPLAARQFAAARRHASQAVLNDTLWRVSLGYLELLRAAEEIAILRTTIGEHRELYDLTKSYADSGQGSAAEVDRTLTELRLRENDLLRAEEAYRVASARLVQLVRLNSDVELQPIDLTILPLDLVPSDTPVGDLVAQGLTLRPELREARHLTFQAVEKMRRERYAILLPSVVLGVSYGGFGGGQGATIANYDERFDADAVVYWQTRNLGFGDRAARAEAAAIVQQTNFQHFALMDQVAREVTEAQFQVETRRKQVELLQRTIESASLSYSRNLERIKQAQGLPIEMLQAIQALNASRREYLRVVTDYNAAQFTLYRAIGSPGDMQASIH